MAPEEALRFTDSGPPLSDDLPIEPLIDAVKHQIAFLNSPKGEDIKEFRFGAKVYPKEDYLLGLEHLLDLHSGARSKEHFLQRLERDFDFYEVYGEESWGDVFITSYYEPVIEGSLKRTGRFTRPLYRQPEDIVEIKLGEYGDKFKDLPPVIRGRLMPAKNKDGYHEVVPYFTREDIDSGDALKGRKLEICWVDPIDGFFLEIQGSGTVKLPKGKTVRVGYSAQNGRPYEAIGRYLKDVIPIEQMTLQNIEEYLRSIPREQAQAILNRNPSYVFFETLESAPVTYLGTPVVPGRTIATDAKYFPKGALAFMSFEVPKFDSPASKEPIGWEKTGRLVIDQDKGGAIKGGGRVDLFWGSGSVARQHAGVMKARGTLYYLAPKERVVSQRRLLKSAGRAAIVKTP